MKWNERVKDLMVQKQLSQKELAKRSGITEASVSRYLSGDREPRIDIIINFAKVLGVSPENILEELSQIKTSPYDEISQAIARNGHNLTDKEKNDLIALLLGTGTSI